jgi:L-histidine N-alpha-methyltransferase
MTAGVAPITIAIHTFGRAALDDLVADVRAGLTRSLKSLPPRWFYDARGSELFDRITRLQEYYQTRTEAAILRQVAPEVIRLVRPEMILELGSGSSEKTRTLIAAGLQDRLSCFAALDVSEETLQRTARRLAEEFPGLRVYAMVGSFGEHLGSSPRFGRQLVVFLGSTIGNLDDTERAGFLGEVRALLREGDGFLLGVDLVKDERELVAAYDDSEGVTAEFNLNLLTLLNRELGADFDPSAFEHVAIFDRARSRIEMHLRARRRQRVSIPGAGLTVDFERDETLRTEISVKFTRDSVEESLAAAGLEVRRWYTDPGRRFALCLSFPSSGVRVG